MKSPRAIGEKFCSKLRFGKRRNTLCISSFSNRKVGTKESLSADGYLFRVSLIPRSRKGSANNTLGTCFLKGLAAFGESCSTCDHIIDQQDPPALDL